MRLCNIFLIFLTPDSLVYNGWWSTKTPLLPPSKSQRVAFSTFHTVFLQKYKSSHLITIATQYIDLETYRWRFTSIYCMFLFTKTLQVLFVRCIRCQNSHWVAQLPQLIPKVFYSVFLDSQCYLLYMTAYWSTIFKMYKYA